MKSQLLALARYNNTWHVMFSDFCILQKARGKLQCEAFISIYILFIGINFFIFLSVVGGGQDESVEQVESVYILELDMLCLNS